MAARGRAVLVAAAVMVAWPVVVAAQAGGQEERAGPVVIEDDLEPLYLDEGRVVAVSPAWVIAEGGATGEGTAPAEGPQAAAGWTIADRGFWHRGPPRWFLAGAIDLGAIYFRPRFSAGWGKPHASWVGLDANPIFSGEGLGHYAGLRLALPWVDLRVGGRYFFTLRRSFLESRESYDHLQIQSRVGPPSRYLSWEAELTTSVPVGPGSVMAELAGTMVTLVDDGFYVFEETIRVVVDPPWVWRARVGYGLSLGPGGVGRLTFLAEAVGIPGRDALVVRGGLEASLLVWDDFEIRGRVIPPLVSEDSLGATGGDSFQLGFRYRFASGTPD